MATTSDFRPGMVIRWNNELWTIVEFQHVNPGNWRAFVRTKLKNMKTGRVLENRFRAGESVDEVRVERRQFQYLYRDGADYVVMDNETFEQINIAPELIGEGQKFLKENTVIDILFDDTQIVAIELPIFVTLEVTQTEPGVKGDTVSNVMKPATLETGAVVNVPLFINQGDKIKIDTRTGEYVERVKE
ncbi:MAG: elongation factor P [Melioribacter sp.]|uniref:elongation factor P n=1 Tax=Rosettibacter primus TaxID=3111523 RepID=UPI00247EF1D7|nr:elongation factor P [Melioribacter sp.]